MARFSSKVRPAIATPWLDVGAADVPSARTVSPRDRTALQAVLDSENQRFPESVKDHDSWITLLTSGFNTLFRRLTSARINRTSAGGFPAQTCLSFQRYSRPPGAPRPSR